MTFNEQDHPRDEMGKFTFKNGGEEKIQMKNKLLPKFYMAKRQKKKSEQEKNEMN